jgi:hypothetical protein
VNLLPHDLEARRRNPKPRSRSEQAEQVEQRIRVEEGLVDRDRGALDRADVCESQINKRRNKCDD